jgi:hypothetical protein
MVMGTDQLPVVGSLSRTSSSERREQVAAYVVPMTACGGADELTKQLGLPGPDASQTARWAGRPAGPRRRPRGPAEGWLPRCRADLRAPTFLRAQSRAEIATGSRSGPIVLSTRQD